MSAWMDNDPFAAVVVCVVAVTLMVAFVATAQRINDIIHDRRKRKAFDPDRAAAFYGFRRDYYGGDCRARGIRGGR